ncbi:MAG TPA: hypothetical protein VGX91_08880 [Candidatus Cybelea sp.]|jgi:hypothetical protein|nr:hypothetical protein [Candidatus Cybelea sp.]
MASFSVLLAAVHVIVDRPIPVEQQGFWLEERFWVAVGAIVTAAMAFFTMRLAADTRDVVRGAKAEAQQRERHHRESLAPLISAKVLEARVAQPMRSADGTLIFPIKLNAKIENVGPGPAAEVSICFIPKGMPRRIFPAAPIAASGTNEEEARYVEGSVGTEIGQPWPFVCGILYSNMFGDLGWVLMSSETGRTDDKAIILSQLASPEADEDMFYQRLEAYTDLL